MSSSGGVQYIGGYHDYIGGYHEYIRDVQYIGGYHFHIWGSKLVKTFQFLLKTPMYSWYPPHASWYPLMYSWYPPMYWPPPDVLMISRQCTHGIPAMYWTHIIQGENTIGCTRSYDKHCLQLFLDDPSLQPTVCLSPFKRGNQGKSAFHWTRKHIDDLPFNLGVKVLSN